MPDLKKLVGQTIVDIENRWPDTSSKVEAYHEFTLVTDAGALVVRCTVDEHIEVEWVKS